MLLKPSFGPGAIIDPRDVAGSGRIYHRRVISDVIMALPWNDSGSASNITFVAQIDDDFHGLRLIPSRWVRQSVIWVIKVHSLVLII